jgi:hypothetical protein
MPAVDANRQERGFNLPLLSCQFFLTKSKEESKVKHLSFIVEMQSLKKLNVYKRLKRLKFSAES